PVRGHRTASGRAACPACGGGGYRSYSYRSSYSSPGPRPRYSGSGSSSGGGSTRRTRSTRSGRVTSVAYTDTEWRTMEPVFEAVEQQAKTHPERRDVF